MSESVDLRTVAQYWMNQPITRQHYAIWRFLDGHALGSREVGLIRDYLLGFIGCPLWRARGERGERVRALWRSALVIDTPSAISVWLYHAEKQGICLI